MTKVGGIKQDYVSGASAERSFFGATYRYFYKRTYGFEVTWYRDIKYEYTSPAGVTTDFGNKVGSRVTGLWNPAMNVSIHLDINLKSTNRTFAGLESSSSSWQFGMEYSF
jgi:lipopolysaccharide assembly outer membrane protein LptD (OstA)